MFWRISANFYTFHTWGRGVFLSQSHSLPQTLVLDPFWGDTTPSGPMSLPGGTPVSGPMSLPGGTPVLARGRGYPRTVLARVGYPRTFLCSGTPGQVSPWPRLGYPHWLGLETPQPGLGYPPPPPATGYTMGGMPRAVSRRRTFLFFLF